MYATRLDARRPRASVYVLQRLDRSRFKIGWALDPLKRVRQLPEFSHELIDLHRSSVLWLPSRHRAEQVERCRSTIAQSDYHGVDRLLCLYGGMGSLNDVILQSGGVVPTEDNERFDALRTNAWKQANALARDGARGNGC